MSVLTDKPITLTKGAEWNSLVRLANRKEIYDVLETIASQCDGIGKRLKEGQAVRFEHCVVAIGNRRWDGKRTCALQFQAPNNDAQTGWDRIQIIDLELNGDGYKFTYYKYNRRLIDNTHNSRVFSDIYRIPMEIFNELKEAISK